jgi:choice-of-anchor A domain-containing protein
LEDFTMKRYARLILMLLPLVLLDQRFAQAGPLTILGVAGQYNVFVFGDLNLSQTDVEGRAAAGGNVILDSFAIGSRVQDEGGIPSLVGGGNVTLTNGSVGCLLSLAYPACVNPQQGTIAHGGALNMPNADVGYGAPAPNSIDFGAAQSHINQLSLQWRGFAPNGTDADPTNNFDFTGTSGTLNIFNVQAAAIITDASSGPSVVFHTPVGSTILVNILGDPTTLNLRNMGFSFGGNPAFPAIAGENPAPFPPDQAYSHNAGFPYSSIVFNFPDATHDIFLDEIALNGSLIAPFANVIFTTNSHIDGNLIALSLSGSGESHAIPFVGDVTPGAPVPEPADFVPDRRGRRQAPGAQPAGAEKHQRESGHRGERQLGPRREDEQVPSAGHNLQTCVGEVFLPPGSMPRSGDWIFGTVQQQCFGLHCFRRKSPRLEAVAGDVTGETGDTLNERRFQHQGQPFAGTWDRKCRVVGWADRQHAQGIGRARIGWDQRHELPAQCRAHRIGR